MLSLNHIDQYLSMTEIPNLPNFVNVKKLNKA